MKQWLIDSIRKDKKSIQNTEKEIDLICESFQSEIYKQIEPLIERLNTNGDDLQTGFMNELKFNDIKRTVQSLSSRELDMLVASILARVIQRVQQSNNIYGDNFEFNFNPVQLVSTQIQGLERQIRQALTDSISRIDKFIDESKNVTKNAFKTGMIEKIGIIASFTKFVSNEVLYGTDRIVRKEQAAKMGELLMYVGPNDQVTRDWCFEHVDKAASKEYWETAENDVGPNPPLLYGGGWNCRHRLLAVQKEWVEGVDIIG